MWSKAEGLEGKGRGETGRRNTLALAQAMTLSSGPAGFAGNLRRERGQEGHFLSHMSGWEAACKEKEV